MTGINGSKNPDNISGNSENNLIKASEGADKLFGFDGYDTLIGDSSTDFNNIAPAGGGNDFLYGGKTLIGGNGTDMFEFSSNDGLGFNKEVFGMAAIEDFDSGSDKISLSRDTFAIASLEDDLLSQSEFELVTDDAAVASSGASIVYSVATENLFYNQNGSDSGLGTGGQFATLEVMPELSHTDFSVI